MMLSDFVSDNTRTRAGSATDQRPFAATGKGADQGSTGRCAAYRFGSIVMTPVVGNTALLSHALFTLGYLLAGPLQPLGSGAVCNIGVKRRIEATFFHETLCISALPGKLNDQVGRWRLWAQGCLNDRQGLPMMALESCEQDVTTSERCA